MIRRHRKNLRAVLSLEAAIVLPLFLTLCLLFQVALATQEAQYLYHAAGEEAARELELIIVVKGLIPWKDYIKPLDIKLPKSIESWLIERIGSEIGALSLKRHSEKLFHEKTQHRPFIDGLLKGSKSPSLKKDEHHWKYEIETHWGRGLYQEKYLDRQVIPDFSLYPFELGEGEGEGSSEAKEDSIWSEHNFVRGKYFRDKYGANLPANFPYLSAFKSGQVVKIQSLDLTAPTWSQAQILEQRLQMDIQQMANYRGEPDGFAGVVIRPEDIQRRMLHYVIPENHEPWQMEALHEAQAIATLHGVEIKISQDGYSHRYESSEDDLNDASQLKRHAKQAKIKEFVFY